MEAILCSQADAGKMLAIGQTKLGELIAQGELESVRIGARRLVRISSVRRLAGVEPDQQGEEAQVISGLKNRSLVSSMSDGSAK